MSLTPADVRNVVFSKSPIGWPGYHQDGTPLLGLVETTLVRLIGENNDLRAHLGNVINRGQRPWTSAAIFNGWGLSDR